MSNAVNTLDFKPEVEHQEVYENDNERSSIDKGDVLDVIHAETEFTEEEYARLRRKIDMILLPPMILAYGIQYIDKTSLAFGVIFGLKKDTGLKGLEYQNLSSFFYMSYALAQIPMMYLLQRTLVARGLGACIVIWGGCVLALGGCNNYVQLVIVRVLIGWFESVITPAFAVLTSSWYLRKEQTLRQNMYFASNYLFAVIFTVGIYFLAKRASENPGGPDAWRVINYFLGGTTIGIAIIFCIFVGTPQEVWWLSKREKLMARARIVSNSTGTGESAKWRWEQVRECFRDPNYYHNALFNILIMIPTGAIMVFQQVIMAGFGFTALQTTLYSLPGYSLILVCLIITAFLVHKWPVTRFGFTIFYQLYVIFIFFFVGFAPDDTNKWVKWGIFLMVSSLSIGTFLIWPLMSVNIAGRTKKSFFGATTLICVSIGQVIGSQIFTPSDAPKYHKGLIACAVIMIVNIINLVTWWFYYRRANAKREAAFLASGMSIEEREHAARVAGESDLTDMQNQHFRYMY